MQYCMDMDIISTKTPLFSGTGERPAVAGRGGGNIHREGGRKISKKRAEKNGLCFPPLPKAVRREVAGLHFLVLHTS